MQESSIKRALFLRVVRYTVYGWWRSPRHHPVPQYSDPSLMKGVKQSLEITNEGANQDQTHGDAEDDLGPHYPQNNGIAVVEGINPNSHQCCLRNVCEIHIRIVRHTHHRCIPAQSTSRTYHSSVTAGIYKPRKQPLVKSDLSARSSNRTHSCGRSEG